MKLSPLMQEIVDVVGIAAAQRLVEAKGGQRVFIPATVKPDHWLAVLIGHEKALVLSRHFNHEGGNNLDLPSALRLHLAERNDRFVKMVVAGKSANAIARQSNISRRWVFEKKRRLALKADSGQDDLFSKKSREG